MKLRSLMMIRLVAVVIGSTLMLSASLAEETNGVNPATIDLQFVNAPCWAMASWLARLTAEPVLVPLNVDFRTTYRTEKKLTREGAIQCLYAILQTNGMSFVNVNQRYYRVVRGSATSPSSDPPHIDVEVQDERFLVNGSPVERKDLSQTIARLATLETEIWVHHLGPKSQPFSPIEIAEMLRSARGLNADRIYLECMPSR